MMIDVFVIVCGLYSVIYIIVSLVISTGERRLRPGKRPSVLPVVSVIVCARNEEDTIRRCIESLRALDYPREKIEILLADDESEDSTLDICKEYAAKDNIFRVFSTAEEPRDLPGKQRPLNLCIRNAKGEIVMVTDADCAVDPGWIWAHIAAYHENTGITGGITAISTDSGSFFARVQNCDQVSKLAVAMGCAGLGVPLTIMGNNMSFRRKAYEACGGFKTIGSSIVEDVDLMYAITRNSEYSLGWAVGKESAVVSIQVRNFNSFIEQRYRMLDVFKKVPSGGKMLIGIEILMFILFGTALILAICDPGPLAVIVLAWIAGYYFVLLPTPGTTSKDILCIPGMIIFQIVYGIALGFRKFFGSKKVIWKGRVYGEVSSKK